MTLKKGKVWLIGLIVIVAYGVGGFLINSTEVILASLSSVVAVIFIGLGVQLGDSVHKSIWFRKELVNNGENQ